jgi:alkylation response protein AidB-like acyl-CoA dehydrogenase
MCRSLYGDLFNMIPRTLFTGEHAMLRACARRFMETEVAPRHARWEEQGYVDRGIWKIRKN